MRFIVWEGTASLNCTYSDDSLSWHCIWCNLCPMQCCGELSTGCSSRLWSFTAHFLTETWYFFVQKCLTLRMDFAVLQCDVPLGKRCSTFWGIWLPSSIKVQAQDCFQLEDEGTAVPWNGGPYSLPFDFQEFWEQPMSAMFVWWDGFHLPFFWYICKYIPWIHTCVW